MGVYVVMVLNGINFGVDVLILFRGVVVLGDIEMGMEMEYIGSIINYEFFV